MILNKPINTKCVILSPHSDDVAFSLGGALKEKYFTNIIVVTVFSVSKFSVNNTDPNKVTEVRKKEDVAFFGSPEVLKYLDKLDVPERKNTNKEKEIYNVRLDREDEKIKNELITFVKMILHDDTLLLAPLALGEQIQKQHIDHLIVKTAACQIMKEGYATAFYEDLPYAGLIELVDINCVVEKTSKDCNTTLEPCLIQLKSDSNNIIKTVSVYKSQLDNLKDDIKNKIKTHGERLYSGGFAERIWCNDKAMQLVHSDKT
jgi:GR25 family glycosyltransferase involved in LPS biosynthesis